MSCEWPYKIGVVAHGHKLQRQSHIDIHKNNFNLRTCASVSPNRAANFRRSGFVIYFWIWNWISSPFRCNWLKTARDQDLFRFTWPVDEAVDTIDDAAFKFSVLANDELCVTNVSKYRAPDEFATDGICCCGCFEYCSELKFDVFEFIYLK